MSKELLFLTLMKFINNNVLIGEKVPKSLSN